MKTKNNAVDIIELAKNYYLLSNDHKGKPTKLGSRIKLEFAFQGIKSDMIIATSGDPRGKKCLVLVDFTTEEIEALIQKADRNIIKLKALKAKN